MDSDTELTANFSEESSEPTEYSFSVTPSPSEGGTVAPNDSSYEAGTEVSVEATPNEGWTFSNWSGDVESSDNPLTFTINSDTEITANFEEDEPQHNLSVSTVPSEGGSVDPTDGSFDEGTEVDVTANPAEGWEFTGWTGDVESAENPVAVTMNSSKSLTANFERKEYELAVTTDPSDGGSVDPADGTYKHGEEVTIEATASEGWEFAGWSGGSSSDENPLTITITSDIKLTANFTQVAQSYSNTMEVSNGSYTEMLAFGMASGATAGFEDNYDEEAPPTPPAGSFYANFRIEGYNLFEDFRPVQNQRTVWELNFGMGESNVITLSWDFSQSEYVGSLTLVDNPDNPSVEIDMSSQSNYKVINSSIDELFIIQE